MATSSSEVVESGELSLVITRVFDAPRGLVYRAWTEPEMMAQWHGPRGFKTTVIKSELRVGGSYRFHMRGPDGADHWTQGVFREIVEPERLAMSGCWTDAEGNPTSPETLVTITLEDLGGKTRLTLRQTGFETVSARDGHDNGWNSSLDCLADYLAAA